MCTESDKAFEKFVDEMKLVLDKHQENNGDSWKTCEFNFLVGKLFEEIEE